MTRYPSYKDYIEALKHVWIGKKIEYGYCIYTVIDVDYNGMLLIDKKATFTDTTAINPYEAKEIYTNE